MQIDFCKCGMAGLCLELLFSTCGSILSGDWSLKSKTSLLMFPIYGMGAFLHPIGCLVDRWIDGGENLLTDRDRIFRHGTLYMVLIFIGEYVSGSVLKAEGICPWDYSGYKSNISGLICLDFAPLWFGTGLFFEKLTTQCKNVVKSRNEACN